MISRGTDNFFVIVFFGSPSSKVQTSVSTSLSPSTKNATKFDPMLPTREPPLPPVEQKTSGSLVRRKTPDAGSGRLRVDPVKRKRNVQGAPLLQSNKVSPGFAPIKKKTVSFDESVDTSHHK